MLACASFATATRTLDRTRGKCRIRVVAGDDLWKVDVSHKRLLKRNDHLADPNVIHPGSWVYLPHSVCRKADAAHKPTTHCTYTVKEGDSMWDIAEDNPMSLRTLIGMNRQVADPHTILPGQKINVPC